MEEEEAGSRIVGNVPVAECPDLRVWESHVPLQDVRHLKDREKRVPRTCLCPACAGLCRMPEGELVPSSPLLCGQMALMERETDSL